jgi:N-acetylneuraminic acid mutarotase
MASRTWATHLTLLFSLFLLASLQACSGGRGNGTGPILSSAAPSTGTVGTIVAIQGSGFLQSGSGTSAVNPTVTFTPVAGGAEISAVVTSFGATGLEVAVTSVPSSLSAAGTVFNITVANPGGGSATLNNAFTMAAPVLTDINGGLTGSGTVGSLFIIDGNNFGDLAALPATGYSADFRDASTNNLLASTAVNFASGDWQNILIVGTVPGTLASSTTYRVTVTTPSGTSAPLNFRVAASVSFSPSTISWTATAGLPTAQQGFPSVIVPITGPSGTSTSYIYALGGNTASSGTNNGKASNVATVSFNQMSNSTGGALANASWPSTTPLPDVRGFAGAVSANGFNSLISGYGNIYILGGLDGAGNATSTVYYASLNADGTIPAVATTGTWATTTPLPQALFAEGAAIFHGRIYVAGGNDSTGAPVAKVYSAKINADGTLGLWQAQADLPVTLAYHQLVTSAGNLYVLGGDTAAADPISNLQAASSQGAIYYQPINIRNGNLANATWTTNASSMGKNREKFSAVVVGSYILVSGGLYNGASTGSSEQSYAQVNTDGSVGSFNGATGSRTISGSLNGYNFLNHSSTYFVDGSGNPHVLILGGEDVNTGAPRAGVWYQH